MKENIKTSAKQSLSLREFKQNKNRFDEECLRFLDERKQVNAVGTGSKSNNVHNLHNGRLETSRQFRENKEGQSEY